LNTFISGLAQGNDPAGGCAVARCLRHAYPDIRLIGVDYSARAAGLHDPVFDDVIIHRPWGEFDTDSLRAFAEEVWAEGACYLPTIDLEGYWIAEQFPDHPMLLAPPANTYAQIAKPISMRPELEYLNLPAYRRLSDGPGACHAFLRKHGFRAWLKAPFHDSIFIRSWESFGPLVDRFTQDWPFGGLHLQQHVDGTHEAIAFSALKGRLLDSIWIVKNDMTPDGKTIGGSRIEISRQNQKALESFVSDLNWTGGGEIELIRSSNGQLWLVEINPRFPAWIAGPLSMGSNLPGSLLEATTGQVAHREGNAGGFVRLQIEVPVRKGFDLLPPLVLSPEEPLDAGKTAFSIRELAEHVEGTVGLPIPTAKSQLPTRPMLPAFPPPGAGATPSWVFSPDQLSRRCDDIRSLLNRPNEDGPEIEVAYSMKTNPDPRLLRIVRDKGFHIETISSGETEIAAAMGFPKDKMVLNGPGKKAELVRSIAESGGLFFVDSLEELVMISRLEPTPTILGLRIRPPASSSRFGIPIEEFDVCERLLDTLRIFPDFTNIGLHIHLPHALVGVEKWRSSIIGLIDFGLTISSETGLPVTVLDLGGGYYPDDFMEELKWISNELILLASQSLPSIKRVFVEPGRAIAQDCFAVETTVLEVRDIAGSAEVVVDAALAEISESGHYPHRLCRWDGNAWIECRTGGKDKLFGRTCMEADVLFSSMALADVNIGDRLLIADTGSYDRSMAYEFGRGRSI
tara:strand:+ start:6781 stop:9000 length:2220 start_codon:yes stop_codon:yes gene_type:complete